MRPHKRNNEMNATYTQSIGAEAYSATQSADLDNLLGQDAQDVSDTAWQLLTLIGVTLIHLDEINWINRRARAAKSPADLLLLVDETTLAQVIRQTTWRAYDLRRVLHDFAALYLECINRTRPCKSCADLAKYAQYKLSSHLSHFAESFGPANPDLSEQSVGSKFIERYQPRLKAYFERVPELDNSALRRIIRDITRNLNLH